MLLLGKTFQEVFKGHSDLFVATYGFCDKPEQICDSSNLKNLLCRPDNQLSAINCISQPSVICVEKCKRHQWYQF